MRSFKIRFLLPLFLALAFSACSDDDNTPSDPGSPGTTPPTNNGGGGGNQPGTAPSPLSCDQVRSRIGTILDFTPSGSNACATDSDCDATQVDVIVDGNLCAARCPMVMTRSRVESYNDFITDNPDLNSLCRQSDAQDCPMAIPGCMQPQPRCISGQCVNDLDFSG